MKLASYKTSAGEKAAFVTKEGLLPLESVAQIENLIWPGDIAGILKSGKLNDLKNWYDHHLKTTGKYRDCLLLHGSFKLGPLLRNPSKIFGIGLNYREHAKDLDETSPEELPGSFMKPSTTIVGVNDLIQIPGISEKTTGEAELCMVIGRECKNVELEDWKTFVAGFTTIIDMTAEDILRKNTRYLTLSKSFDTFLSVGYELITPDEINDINSLSVETWLNDHLIAINQVRNMTFTPDRLIHILSGIMTLYPGDMILTGTPGAAVLGHNDKIEARIEGFSPLVNYVTDLKKL
jgi:2-keto-4-pentenoate hydratase/2-oxohepta-3-ene-1,7-dioic acid hydratase in catechol pathway